MYCSGSIRLGASPTEGRQAWVSHSDRDIRTTLTLKRTLRTTDTTIIHFSVYYTATRLIYCNPSCCPQDSRWRLADGLLQLSFGLQSCSANDLIAPVGLTKDVAAIKALSSSCKKDCDELLEIVQQLKSDNGSWGRWQSFRVALKTLWEKKKITELEERLNKTQVILTLHICNITLYFSPSAELFSRSLTLRFSVSGKATTEEHWQIYRPKASDCTSTINKARPDYSLFGWPWVAY